MASGVMESRLGKIERLGAGKASPCVLLLDLSTT